MLIAMRGSLLDVRWASWFYFVFASRQAIAICSEWSSTVTLFYSSECIFWLATAGSIPGSDDMRLVRAFKEAEISDGCMP